MAWDPLPQHLSASSKVYGLTLIPEIYGQDGALPSNEKFLRLYENADLKSAVLAEASASKNPLESIEFSYETSAAVSYGLSSEGWVQVYLPTLKKFAWLPPDSKHKILKLEDFFSQEQLFYLNQHWNKKLLKATDLNSVSVALDNFPQLVGRLELPSHNANVSGNLLAYLNPDDSVPFAKIPLLGASAIAKTFASALEDSDSCRAERECAALDLAQRSLPILEVRGDWYRVPLSDDVAIYKGKSAWVRSDESRGTRVVLFEAKGRADQSRRYYAKETAKMLAEPSVKILTKKFVNDRFWFEVELLSHSACQPELGAPRVLARGWLELLAPTGRPQIWYYSRGC